MFVGSLHHVTRASMPKPYITTSMILRARADRIEGVLVNVGAFPWRPGTQGHMSLHSYPSTPTTPPMSQTGNASLSSPLRLRAPPHPTYTGLFTNIVVAIIVILRIHIATIIVMTILCLGSQIGLPLPRQAIKTQLNTLLGHQCGPRRCLPCT